MATRYFFSIGVLGVLVCALGYGYSITRTIPEAFPRNKKFIVYENESLRSISKRLEEEHYIRSALFFRVWVSSYNKDRQIQLGEYLFPEDAVLGAVVKKFALLGADSPLLSVTVPEGSTSSQVATLFGKVLPTFAPYSFVQKVTQAHIEGTLFPSTYFLVPSYKEEDVIALMEKTFREKTKELFSKSEIPFPLADKKDVLVLASIVEGEAKTEEDMRVVAGILLTRLTKGMPLQVDVAKETYTTKGLPLEPINNPGLTALSAVLHPLSSPYLFYLTGRDGKMYYAKTFEEHKRNIRKYLK